MFVLTSTTIDGKVVTELDFKIGQYKVFSKSDDDSTLYFVDRSGTVIGKIDIECGMSQGCGYVEKISGVSFQGPTT